MGAKGIDPASDMCRRRYILLAPSPEQARIWRQRRGLAPSDVDVVDTSSIILPSSLALGPNVEVVLADGWRFGRYGDHHLAYLARLGFTIPPA